MTKTLLHAFESATGVMLHHSKPSELRGKRFSIGRAFYCNGDRDRFCGFGARFRGHLFMVCYLPVNR